MSGPILSAERIEHRAGSFALSVKALRIETGEYVCLTGPSGSGKTTLLETIAGIRRLHAGSIRYRGVDVTKSPPEERFIGFAYQDSLLLPFLNAEDNILFGARAGSRYVDGASRDRARALMARMGIEPLRERFPRHLSGGERQRVSLARALLRKPPLALLDEPLASLDPELRRSLRDFLKTLGKEEGIAVLHVTHDAAEAAELADRVVRMRGGRLSEDGSSEKNGGRMSAEDIFQGRYRG